MSEQQRQSKQRYLRQNILEKQFDPEEFMDFCQNYKGSVDIDSWTLYELQDIVNRFIQDKKTSAADDFSSFQMAAEIPSPTKQPSTNDDWASFSSNIPQVQPKQQVALNSTDLDFLEMMGMSVPAKKQEPKPLQKIQKPIQQTQLNPKLQFNSVSTNLQKPKPKNPNEEFVKQMQNENFIAVFNNPLNLSKTSSSPDFDPFGQIQKSAPQSMAQTQKNSIPNPPLNIAPQKKTTSQPNIPPSNQNKSMNIQPIIKPQRDYPQSGPQQQFECEIKCKQISKNKLTSQNLICRIISHQVVNPNVFVPNFVQYTIQTMPLNISVKRRMKDFQQLRTLLKKLFPTTQIPYLQRYSRLSQTEPHIISKQKIQLESFLNSLLMNPLLRCRVVEDFLLCTNMDNLKKIFRQLQKAQRPKAVEDLWTLSGTVKLSTDGASRKYMNQQQLYVEYVQNSFSKLKALYDQMIAYYQNTAKIVDEIATVYDQLKETTKVVNQNFEQNLRFHGFEPMLGEVTYIHRQLSESIQRQSKTIQSQLKQLFKYEISNISTVKDNMKTLNNICQAYEKRSDKQAAKRQVYEGKKLAEWKVGAQLPSKHITVLKHQSAYAQNQFKQELCRYMDELTKKIGGQVEIFSTLQISIAADMDMVWRQFQKFVEKR